ncbi:MAG: flavodoxin family protein [Candidatus Thorarchaeota archaeon]|jgi:multimeric flavodoxin WrbA
MSARILGISGSPRFGGNTTTLIQVALDAACEHEAMTELIELSELHLEPCDHCNECFEQGKCVKNDDLNKIAEKMRTADAIILGSPVHYASVSESMKTLIDRIGRFAHLEGKVGCGFVVGRRSGTDTTLHQLHFFMLVKEMIIPGSLYWGVGYALNSGDIRADNEAIDMAKQMGRRVAELAEILVKAPVPWSFEPRTSDEKVRFGDEWRIKSSNKYGLS